MSASALFHRLIGVRARVAVLCILLVLVVGFDVTAHAGELLTEIQLSLLHRITEAVVLAFAAASLARAAHVMGADDQAGLGWRLMMFGALAYLVGQFGWIWLEARHGPDLVPYPAWPDVFYGAGQFLVVAGMLLNVVAFANTGLPLGSRWSYVGLAFTGAVALALIVWKLVVPLWESQTDSVAGKVVSSLYVGLDFATAFIAILLFRMAMVFRDGGLARIVGGWGAMSAGFALLTLADGLDAIDQVEASNVVYLLSYGAIAFGATRHEEVITADYSSHG
jgi:hypothetical protein